MRPRASRRAWLGGALGLAAGGAWAQTALTGGGTPGVDLPPLPQPPRPVQLPPMLQHRLANGVTVVTVPRPEVPVVSAVLMLRAGGEDDPPGKPGVAAMTATLLAKGTRRGARVVSAGTLALEAEALGGPLNTGSGWRTLSVSMSVATPQLPAALALIADVLRRPTFSPDELERARTLALDDLRLSMGSPPAVAAKVLRRLFWGDSPPGAVISAAALQRLAIDDLRQFHARHALPEQAVLVLAGDLQPERAAQLAQQVLGDWDASGALQPQRRLAPPQPLDAPLALVDMPANGQCGVALAAPFVRLGAGNRRIGLVANAVLGGGYSARLNSAVRIRRGLSYGAFSDVESHTAGGLLVASAQTDARSAPQVLTVLREELLRMAEAPPSPAELAARQASLVGSFARGLQTTGGLALLAANQLANGRSLAELQRHVPELLAVTPEQVQDFARRHWAPESLRAVVAGDLTDAADALARSAPPDTLRLSAQQLDFDRLDLGARR